MAKFTIGISEVGVDWIGSMEDNNMSMTINLSGISSGNLPTDPVTITASASVPSLFSSITVNYISPQSTGTIVLTPVENAEGDSTITVTVKNDKLKNNTTSINFLARVRKVNPPTINPLADLLIYS